MAPLSRICKEKTGGKIWLAGRAASPCAERGRQLKKSGGEDGVKRHYALEERAFEAAKLTKIYRELNSGWDLAKINIAQKQSQPETSLSFCEI